MLEFGNPHGGAKKKKKKPPLKMCSRSQTSLKMIVLRIHAREPCTFSGFLKSCISSYMYLCFREDWNADILSIGVPVED